MPNTSRAVSPQPACTPIENTTFFKGTAPFARIPFFARSPLFVRAMLTVVLAALLALTAALTGCSCSTSEFDQGASTSDETTQHGSADSGEDEPNSETPGSGTDSDANGADNEGTGAGNANSTGSGASNTDNSGAQLDPAHSSAAIDDPNAGALENLPDGLLVDAQGISSIVNGSEPYLFLDVRSLKAFESQQVDGSMGIPINQLEFRTDEIPRDTLLVVIAANAINLQKAYDILTDNGFDTAQIRGTATGLDELWHVDEVTVVTAIVLVPC